MILISMLLVLVGAVTLVIGALLRDDLTLVWVSIGACILAAVFLVLGVVRSRPKPTPTPSSDGATWSGASSTSGRSEATVPEEAGGEDAGEVEVLTAEEVAAQPVGEERGGTAVAEEVAESPAAPRRLRPLDEEPVLEGSSDEPSGDGGAREEAPSEDAPAGAPGDERVVVDTADRSATDEARFAALTDVSGVGPARASDLRAHFSSYAALRRASLEELMEVDGISEVLATRIREHLDADD